MSENIIYIINIVNLIFSKVSLAARGVTQNVPTIKAATFERLWGF